MGLFNKTTPDQKRRIALYSQLVEQIPSINRYSYRKKGKFEIIFDDTIGDIEDPQNQAWFNLFAHAWIIIWGYDSAELHIGKKNLIGFRLELNAAKLYVGHKFEDHDNMLEELLNQVGISRSEMV